MNASVDRLARDIGREIEFDLERLGIFSRVFSRAKQESSIKKKADFKGYQASGKLLQDLIGIRIAVYFSDDVPIVEQILKARSNFLSETVDKTEETVFKPIRLNFVFRLNDVQTKEVSDVVIAKYAFVDNTYEIQLRTVLSEGWHEVDHDLRYKTNDDWVGCSDIARTFNGVYASLVTNDWSILAIFEQLAYRHYKSKSWSAMLRSQFRIRFADGFLDPRIVKLFDENPEVAKKFFRLNRGVFLKALFKNRVRLSLSLNNLVFLANLLFVKNAEIKLITPTVLLELNLREIVDKD